MIYLMWFFIYSFKHDRDTARTNFSRSIAYKILPNSYLKEHGKWFTGNLWQKEEYLKNRLLIFTFISNDVEWFLVKNVLTFLNDYWKFNEFFLMALVCLLLGMLSSYWLILPYFIIGGLLHSLLDGSLFRKRSK